MKQSSLFDDEDFDTTLARALKEEGLTRASTSREDILALGRQLCVMAALKRNSRTATADDATRGFKRYGLPADSLGPAAGALFRGPQWQFTGIWRTSLRTTNHARQNRVWRYAGPL